MAVSESVDEQGRPVLTLTEGDALRFWRMMTSEPDPPQTLADAARRFRAQFGVDVVGNPDERVDLTNP